MKLEEIAAKDIGLQENPRGSNKGKDLEKFFRATDLDQPDGYPWCAAAVSFWVQQYIRANKLAIKEPRIAGVIFFREWAQRNGLTISSKPKPGAIVVFMFSHIGVVEALKPDGGITTIEGNTNDDGSREGYRVCRRGRVMSECKFFIHLPTP